MTALLSYILLDETLNGIEFLGCLLVFASTLFTSAEAPSEHVDFEVAEKERERLRTMSAEIALMGSPPNERTRLV